MDRFEMGRNRKAGVIVLENVEEFQNWGPLVETIAGPGGRWFKSNRPDHFF